MSLPGETPYLETEILMAVMEDRGDDAAEKIGELRDHEVRTFLDQIDTLREMLTTDIILRPARTGRTKSGE